VIGRPHGIRGELKVRLHNEDSDALFHVSHLVAVPVSGIAQMCEVESVRGSPKTPILALVGCMSREDADAFRGAQLWIERGSFQPLEPGEYYLIDLIGCSVLLNNQIIAQVKDVRPDPSVDTMVLTMTDGKRAEVPIVDAWVGEVNIKSRTVKLLNDDGIIID
jgi:16S rRNA processing protein RimM